jgi:hypothetical protein
MYVGLKSTEQSKSLKQSQLYKMKEDIEDKQLKHCYPTMKEMVGKIDGTKPRMINDMKRIVGPYGKWCRNERKQPRKNHGDN